tara:strand:+ start:295 stop:594 length:300 start_codon:yes stop_codon:yes gene_type:complete
MRSTFCPSCGGKNEYSYQPPKFCNNCGTSFGSLSGSTTEPKTLSTKKNILKKKPTVALKEDETDIEFVPSLARLEYEIDVPQDNIHKMSDIFNEGRNED